MTRTFPRTKVIYRLARTETEQQIMREHKIQRGREIAKETDAQHVARIDIEMLIDHLHPAQRDVIEIQMANDLAGDAYAFAMRPEPYEAN